MTLLDPKKPLAEEFLSIETLRMKNIGPRTVSSDSPESVKLIVA